MEKSSDEELKRQDFVDNEIYNIINRLNPSKREIEWDIEMIGGRQVPRKLRLVSGLKGHSQKLYLISGKPCPMGIEIHIRDTIQHWLVDKYKIVEELEFYP
jgi:hypothetical protein